MRGQHSLGYHFFLLSLVSIAVRAIQSDSNIFFFLYGISITVQFTTAARNVQFCRKNSNENKNRPRRPVDYQIHFASSDTKPYLIVYYLLRLPFKTGTHQVYYIRNISRRAWLVSIHGDGIHSQNYLCSSDFVHNDELAFFGPAGEKKMRPAHVHSGEKCSSHKQLRRGLDSVL